MSCQKITKEFMTPRFTVRAYHECFGKLKSSKGSQKETKKTAKKAIVVVNLQFASMYEISASLFNKCIIIPFSQHWKGALDFFIIHLSDMKKVLNSWVVYFIKKYSRNKVTFKMALDCYLKRYLLTFCYNKIALCYLFYENQ